MPITPEQELMQYLTALADKGVIQLVAAQIFASQPNNGKSHDGAIQQAIKLCLRTRKAIKATGPNDVKGDM